MLNVKSFMLQDKDAARFKKETNLPQSSVKNFIKRHPSQEAETMADYHWGKSEVKNGI